MQETVLLTGPRRQSACLDPKVFRGAIEKSISFSVEHQNAPDSVKALVICQSQLRISHFRRVAGVVAIL